MSFFRQKHPIHLTNTLKRFSLLLTQSAMDVPAFYFQWVITSARDYTLQSNEKNKVYYSNVYFKE